MFRPRQLAVVALICLGSSTALFAADTIARRGADTKLSGKITSVTKDQVSIDTNKGKVDVPTAEIVEISWDGEPAAIKSARSHAEAGRLPQAADGFAKAETDNKSDRNEVKVDIEYFIARTEAQMALVDPQKVPDALKRLNDFQSKNGDSRNFYDSLGLIIDLNLVSGDLAAARTAAEKLAKAAASDRQLAAKVALGRVALQENNLPEAQKEFEEVVASTGMTSADMSRKLEAKLGLASCLQRQNQYDQSIKLLDEVISQADPEDARVQAEAYVRQGDSLQASGKAKEALLAYLHVDVLFPGEKSYHPEALYHLSRLWTAVQQPDRASEAADKLTTDYPQSPWTQKLKAPAGAGS